MGYTIARWIFKALLVCLTLVTIPLAIALIQVLVAFPRDKFPDNLYSTILGWFFLPGASLTGTLSITGTLIFLLILTGIITAIGELHSGGVALKKYLRDVADKNSDLKPVGFSQQSALISVSVPLDDIFIHLHATTDRPRFDLPAEQLKHLEELRKRGDLTLEQREEELQALRVVWHSQLGSGLFEARSPQNIDVEDVIEQLTAKQAGAVILGSPGSGKSTTMRWLAYHMAKAGRLPLWKRDLNGILRFLSRVVRRQFALKDALPEKMAPAQIPVLVRISDYAKALSKSESETQEFQPFFMDYLRGRYPELPKLAERLLDELEKGYCLLLLDGLDEVASDELRRRVGENIATFVKRYSPENANARRFNRFIITSRIVGYEGGVFANYAHYTLQDLEDEQIEEFLANWCPAVERHQKTFAQGMKRLTPSQTEQANKEGREQQERLWEALQENPSIKRLAVNPLMLTILALIQRSGKTLPHRRIELYQIVTRTLLDNWNQEKGRRVFPAEELVLAENMMSSLAYEMHTHDRLLTETKVKEIVGKAMRDFFQQEPTEQKIKSFIETLRSSSGVFIETGQGFFSFMHRTFQEYFAAQYLLQLPFEQLKQSVTRYTHKTTWHEPLLLLIAYKSTQNSYEEQQRASELIRIILETKDDYDQILQRNLLLAASCVVDCSAWSVQHALQHRITNQLFTLYGDALDSGRYTVLQEDIERIVLLWLKAQPQESTNARPPFLDAWYCALCDDSQQVRQKGAVHLLAAMAPDLPRCPKPVLSMLLPPLLQLADVGDIACPPEHIRKQLSRTVARPATLRVTEYAFVALRLLDEAGPAGWLHKEWLRWNKDKPELLELLTQHALELDYLLTPAALPHGYKDPDWKKQDEIGKKWKSRAQRNPHELQIQLLQASTTARFPHAWLFKKLLLSEEAAETQNRPWQATWNKVLQEEMERGRSGTYQACLDLRLLLTKGNQQQHQDIITELQTALSLSDMKQILALNAMINIHFRYFLDLRYLLSILDLRYLLDIHDLRDVLNFSYLSDFRYIRDICSLLDLQSLIYIRDILNTIDIREPLNSSYLNYFINFRYLYYLPSYESIISELLSLLKKRSTQSPTILLCIYSIITNNPTVLALYKTDLTDSMREFANFTRQQHTSTLEERLLIEAINRVLKEADAISVQATTIQTSRLDTPDERARRIAALHQETLKKDEVEELLTACTDTRATTKETWQELTGEDMSSSGSSSSPGTVGELAWKQLSQQWKMDSDARDVVLQKLDDSDAIICAGAALLLQQSKQFTVEERKKAGQKIMRMLRDENLSRRPLDPPERYVSKLWRLDDVLFETLRVLAE